MDQRLASIIAEYIAAVSSAVNLLEQGGIARPASDLAWACNGIPQRGVLPGGVKYSKHGYGCRVDLETGPVDFDFGRKGQINGFDAWRLADFVQDRMERYGFSSEEELLRCFDAEVASGSFLYSGYTLHYVHGDASAAMPLK